MKKWFSGYNLRAFLYMLQQAEYSAKVFWKWYARAKTFRRIEKRGRLKWTTKAKILALLTFGSAIILLPLTLLFAPIVLPIILLFWNGLFGIAQLPVRFRIKKKAQKILANHKATKVVIVGSYGKTTAKEVFATVFGKDARATIGNENTMLGIARFVQKLKGDEKVLVFELGEFKFGEIREMCETIDPDFAVYTGVSGAHLDTLKNIDGVVKTLNEVREFVPTERIAVNSDNKILSEQKAEWYFGEKGVNKDKIKNIQLSADGVKFDFLGMKVESPLLGRHNIAIVAFAVFFAKKVLNLNDAVITKNLSELQHFPHRMAPRYLGGSLIIDDTYNGNLEGVRAGLELIKNLPFEHKVYVTPGLVEQGDEQESAHLKIGELIAESGVNKVYLMQNTVTRFIQNGLKKSGFKGQINIVPNPLDFYENLDAITIPNQVILMQNDWSDGSA